MVRKAWIITHEPNGLWVATEWEVDDRSTPLRKTDKAIEADTRPDLEAQMLKAGIGHQDIIGD